MNTSMGAFCYVPICRACGRKAEKGQDYVIQVKHIAGIIGYAGNLETFVSGMYCGMNCLLDYLFDATNADRERVREEKVEGSR